MSFAAPNRVPAASSAAAPRPGRACSGYSRTPLPGRCSSGRRYRGSCARPGRWPPATPLRNRGAAVRHNTRPSGPSGSRAACGGPCGCRHTPHRNSFPVRARRGVCICSPAPWHRRRFPSGCPKARYRPGIPQAAPPRIPFRPQCKGCCRGRGRTATAAERRIRRKGSSASGSYPGNRVSAAGKLPVRICTCRGRHPSRGDRICTGMPLRAETRRRYPAVRPPPGGAGRC